MKIHGRVKWEYALANTRGPDPWRAAQEMDRTLADMGNLGWEAWHLKSGHHRWASRAWMTVYLKRPLPGA